MVMTLISCPPQSDALDGDLGHGCTYDYPTLGNTTPGGYEMPLPANNDVLLNYQRMLWDTEVEHL